jgi:cytochrome c oxidase subunit III
MELTIKYRHNQGAQRFTMWLSIVAISMTFAGFTSAFIVRKGAGAGWTGVDLPASFMISTFLILFSSVTLHVAHISNKKQNRLMTSVGLFFTLAAGISFCVLQYTGWYGLVQQGFFPAFNPNPAPQYFFALVLIHGLHAAGGLVFLFVAFLSAVKALRTSNGGELIDRLEESETGYLRIRTDLLTIYWHFIGALWLYIFIFLTFNLKN